MCITKENVDPQHLEGLQEFADSLPEGAPLAKDLSFMVNIIEEGGSICFAPQPPPDVFQEILQRAQQQQGGGPAQLAVVPDIPEQQGEEHPGGMYL